MDVKTTETTFTVISRTQILIGRIYYYVVCSFKVKSQAIKKIYTIYIFKDSSSVSITIDYAELTSISTKPR